jgi:uncharacterized membrane protein
MRESVGVAPLFAQIALVYFIVPAIIALAVSEGMRKLGWIKAGQMKLQ